MGKVTLSLVIPVMNERENIAPMIEQVQSALKDYTYELIFVDDGSSDGTVDEIKKYADEKIKVVVFYRNYGQTTAMSAGIHEAVGDYVVTLDGDLQNDPSNIPDMLELLIKEGWDVVAGNRLKRKDKALVRKLPSKIANALIRRMTGIHIKDYGCTLKVFTKDIAKNLGLYGELHRFIPILAHLQGAKITQVDVKHHARIHGNSKYGLNRTFKVLSDLILMVFFQKYFQKPLHLFAPVGILSIFIGLAVNGYLLIEKLMGADIWGRPLLILGVIFLLGGLQMITFGVMAELMMRTYYESQNKQTYSIREVYVGEQRPTTSDALAS
ncbi:glycosyltransferase family 2 protein [Sediminitomix flava]|uniref:Glycosyltransferase involved in cell wall biosynthesis n=1 Tax=Sediminitomix flava TaxID=379075 RepID=A0A315ZBV3_SEDFL|nr:glycosyltransferase family 2 protein [Sediminitomix flava]PWJ42268.1 glycosyltransferase involved in cell wall biosynthesis [Sediminitomix flava]